MKREKREAQAERQTRRRTIRRVGRERGEGNKRERDSEKGGPSQRDILSGRQTRDMAQHSVQVQAPQCPCPCSLFMCSIYEENKL